MTKVSAKEFKKYRRMVQPMISDEELFCLFEKAFGPHGKLDDKVDFIKDILRRYKAMGELVCVRMCVTIWHASVSFLCAV